LLAALAEAKLAQLRDSRQVDIATAQSRLAARVPLSCGARIRRQPAA